VSKLKIIVLGGGESGVGAALLAKNKGFEVLLSDQGILNESYKNTLIQAEIAFEEGKHSLEQILKADEVIISPGIPEKNPVVQAIKNAQISLVSEIEFAARYTQAKIIAITGSNGKTTTTLLTYHILKKAGLKVGLAGNIGQSFAKQVMENEHDYYVLEISSFQLDRCYSFAPDVAVLINISPDHLDRYEYKFENYIRSKLRIFQNAKENSTCIYWADDQVILKNIGSIPKSSHHQIISFTHPKANALIGEDRIIIDQQLEIDFTSAPLKGPHNAINMSAAILAAKSIGINDDVILKALPSFVNAEHRLENCGNWNGIQFINDSKATNVDAVYFALNSFKQPIILIIGGVDKGNEYAVLDDLVRKNVKGIICLGLDNQKLIDHFSSICPQIYATDQLENAVQKSLDWAQPQDIVLLSPACASFDLFKNYEDRGRKFKDAIKKLTNGK
jgi:UDP-N-acetylmuramoylalanine--D-glutamate ligase